MNSANRQGTFWVIDGVRVKKKQPYIVTQIARVLQIVPPKQQKNPQVLVCSNEAAVMAGEKHFFTEKSYQDFADKRMDYGMIRFSSLSSVRGDIFSWGQNHQIGHSFSLFGSSENDKDKTKKSIFENQFCGFEYIGEECEEFQSDNMMKIHMENILPSSAIKQSFALKLRKILI